ncbi:unnamed protein product [Adineta ricciae]|uniref:Uncharacterized protein n=1 Tax=Adineta ricciae TaxID=249248 RepID=A0A814ICJ4_ADIRI|nr:unnamed protein product [Adineta ricciae]CAF1278343.1 unnamed protein product [Adineta ricciae]
MLIWYFIALTGCCCIHLSYGQDPAPALSDRESRYSGIAQVPGVVPDSSVADIVDNQITIAENGVVTITNILSTTEVIATTLVPQPFSCFQCTDCHNKPDLTTAVCEADIKMCYSMTKLVNNISQIIRRGCSTSKDHCIVSTDDETNVFESVTCCKSHKCNEATQYLPMFFLCILSLFIIIVNNILHI